MIAALRGRVALVEPPYVVVECGGVGFEVMLAEEMLASLAAEPGAEIEVHVKAVYRPESSRLFGFATRTDRRAFERLIELPGVGPALAMALLSKFNAGNLARICQRGDTRSLTAVPGVGPKSAARIIADIARVLAFAMGEGGDQKEAKDSEVLAALAGLGYTAGEAVRRLKTAKTQAPPDASVEDLIRLALSERPNAS